jgi:hypothetical protein
MKYAFFLFVGYFLSTTAFAQGQLHFNNRVGTEVNAGIGSHNFPVELGRPGFTAELVRVHNDGSLMPLLPQTTFRATSLAASYFVNPVDITVPGVAPGESIVVRMRVFLGANFENSLERGESPNFIVTLGGGLLPPANLVGLTGFNTGTVPEPRTMTLLMLGLAMALIKTRQER